MMVNAYPFFAYSGNSDQISLDYALFKPNSGVVDSGNGLKYDNLFEAQLDAVYAAMDLLKFNDLKIVVTETGIFYLYLHLYVLFYIFVLLLLSFEFRFFLYTNNNIVF